MDEVWVNSRSHLTEYGWFRFENGVTRPQDPPRGWFRTADLVVTSAPCLAVAADGGGRMCCLVTGIRSPRSDHRAIRDCLLLIAPDGVLTRPQRGLASAYLTAEARLFQGISSAIMDAREAGITVDPLRLRELLDWLAACGNAAGPARSLPVPPRIVRDSPENRVRLAALLASPLESVDGAGLVAVVTRSKRPDMFAGLSGWVVTDHSAAPPIMLDAPEPGLDAPEPGPGSPEHLVELASRDDREHVPAVPELATQPASGAPGGYGAPSARESPIREAPADGVPEEALRPEPPALSVEPAEQVDEREAASLDDEPGPPAPPDLPAAPRRLDLVRVGKVAALGAGLLAAYLLGRCMGS